MFAYLFTHFGGLLKKLLFLGRTLLLRLWASKPYWGRNGGSRASKRCGGAAFRIRDVSAPFPYLKRRFGGVLKKLLFLGQTLLLQLWAGKLVLLQEC